VEVGFALVTEAVGVGVKAEELRQYPSVLMPGSGVDRRSILVPACLRVLAVLIGVPGGQGVAVDRAKLDLERAGVRAGNRAG
jgi:hypothetical protein